MARGGLNKNAAVVLGVVVLGLLYYFNTTDSFDPYKVDTNNPFHIADSHNPHAAQPHEKMKGMDGPFKSRGEIKKAHQEQAARKKKRAEAQKVADKHKKDAAAAGDKERLAHAAAAALAVKAEEAHAAAAAAVAAAAAIAAKADEHQKAADSLRPEPKEELHPAYNSLLREYPFQPVRTQSGRMVNIILVRSAMDSRSEKLYEQYKDEILFMGISSFEDYPLASVNPFSGKYAADKYTGLFPGFLHMLHEPEKVFPTKVKQILMSQSDFSLPAYPARDYSVQRKYDFTYSGSDQDVRNDCVGWSSFAKNWSFVLEALEVMCDLKMTGVLVATKSKDGKKACTIPKSCEGLITQTTFLDQRDFFGYLKQSRFAFLPQIHDASPRVSTQALALDVPMLMNSYISGGWKYMNEKTGEFFHDMSDFKQQLLKIVANADIPHHYEPRKWVLEHYGDPHSGPRLFKFVQDNFLDRVFLPHGTTMLLT